MNRHVCAGLTGVIKRLTENRCKTVRISEAHTTTHPPPCFLKAGNALVSRLVLRVSMYGMLVCPLFYKKTDMKLTVS